VNTGCNDFYCVAGCASGQGGAILPAVFPQEKISFDVSTQEKDFPQFEN